MKEIVESFDGTVTAFTPPRRRRICDGVPRPVAPLRGCIATKYCHDLPLRNALQLDLAQEGAFRLHAFFRCRTGIPAERTNHKRRRLHVEDGRATLAPPHKGRATALAPSRRGHANTAVKDEPQRWSRAEPRTKGRIAKAWQYLPIVHDLRDSDGKRAP